MTDSVRYFHGGKRGLAVGGYILPPSETKVPSTPDYGEMGGLHRKDRVYVTTALKTIPTERAKACPARLPKPTRQRQDRLVQSATPGDLPTLEQFY
jgi:hypothetical protein